MEGRETRKKEFGSTLITAEVSCTKEVLPAHNYSANNFGGAGARLKWGAP